MSEAYIGLGSNLDGPILQLNQAVNRLKKHPAITVAAVSSFYRSAPWGGVPQAPYINAVARLVTLLKPCELLKELQLIERQQKRDRQVKWGPRTLDLDILLFDQLELNSTELTVPHLYLTEREFVVYPLAEIAPGLCLPNGRTIEEVMTICPRNSLVKLQGNGSPYPGDKY